MPDKFHFLKVGCADCTVIYLNSKVVVVDCHQGNSDNGEEDILDYLPNKRIDVLILTHQHYDHFDGIQTLLDNNIVVGEIWESNYQRRRGDNSVGLDEWNEYKRLISKLNATVYHPTRSTKDFDTIGGAHFQFLNPPENINENPTRELHDAALVFTVRKNKSTVTFTGDASDSALESVSNYFSLKQKDLLHASHHGSINGAYLGFIKKINPNYTVISTKSGVHNNVPHPTALSRYRTHTRTGVRRTDTDGTQIFTVN